MDNQTVTSLAEQETLKDLYETYRKEGRVEFITFHPSYSYEEFIEGITVETGDECTPSEKLQYRLKAGLFKDLCKRALGAALGQDPKETKKKPWKEVFSDYLSKRDTVDFASAPRFVLIIDEINRGDISKIFGELITLLEADKRLKENNELIAHLPVSGDDFGVPGNLYIIGTMNTADRSIALLDVALRRRFGFVEMNPDFEMFEKEYLQKNKVRLEEKGCFELLQRSSRALVEVNKKICAEKAIGRDKQIGHSFLFKVNSMSDLLLVWRHEILPLLEEYCYGDYGKINRLLFNKDSNTDWIDQSTGVKDLADSKDLSKMLDEIIKNAQK
jgi:5-methylcytosine-specific restriction protein B